MHTEPQETVAARWEVCSPETAGGFLGRRLLLRPRSSEGGGRPIGLILRRGGRVGDHVLAAPSVLRAYRS